MKTYDLQGLRALIHNRHFRAAAKEKRGELYIYDAIGSGWFAGISSRQVRDALKEFKSVDSLDVYINSPGGSVFEGVTIYNLLRRFDEETAPVHIHIDGLAASIASVIALAGSKITTAANAMWMIHNPWNIVVGDAAEMRKMAADLDKIRDSIRATYINRTKKSVDEITKLMDAESWLTAAEAKKLGLTDDVAEEEKEDAFEASVAPLMAQARTMPGRIAELMNLALNPPPPAAPPQEASEEKKEKPMLNKIKAALGLPENATEAEVIALLERNVAAMKADAAMVAEFAKLAGRSSPTASEALPILAAAVEKAGRVEALVKENEGLKAEKRTAAVVALLDAATASGKLTPAKREELLKAEAPAFAKDPEQLKVFLDCLPVVAGVKAPTVTKGAVDPVDPTVTLTPEEVHAGKQMGLTENQMLEAKKARAAKQ